MITVYWGNDKRLDLAFTNDDGTALNLTDYTIFFTVKKKFTDPDTLALISETVTSHDNAVGGLSHIDISHDDTKSCAGKYFCDIKLKDSAGRFTTFYTGDFQILEAITQRES